MFQKWYGNLATVKNANATALANSSTSTSLLLGTDAAAYPFPGGILKVGDCIAIDAGGQISTKSASPGTFTFTVVTGGSTVIFNGGASPTVATSATNLTWYLRILLTCLATGASGNFIGTGFFATAALSATTPIQLLPASAPAAGSNQSTLAGFTIDLFGKWSVADPTNTIQTMQYALCYQD